jgi:phosphoglycerate dehydrogenase-like enzyme
MLKLLHLASQQADPTVWSAPFRTALAEIGTLRLVEQATALTPDERLALIQECDVLLTSWGSAKIPPSVAAQPGKLRYLCNITGEMKGWVPPELVATGLPITNWGDAPAFGMAEGAMTLLLATLKDLHQQIQRIRGDGWALDTASTGGSLQGLHVGIYGCGVIGRQFIELLRPFQAIIRVYDPYTESLPDGCQRVASLEALFDASQAIVIHAGLTPETRKSVNADLLRRLPRHGILINTARGAIVDQEALLAELASGRLRAGLDVLDPDVMPAGHPARSWENCILTAHQICREWPTDGQARTTLHLIHQICLDNLRRFATGQALRFVVDQKTYNRQT